MPRKKTVVEDDKKNKKNIINTMFKEIKDEDHIILQLPITQQKINSLLSNTEKNETIPIPYETNSYYLNDNSNNLLNNENDNIINKNNLLYFNNNHNTNICCYWCCYPIESTLYGMPYNYDSINDTYLLLGSFCSLQCANAHNFSIHCGSDKVWEINSWIQMLAKRYGINNQIRPAPSRYLLKMFNGNLDIDEFRKAHINNDKTYILNIPPMISIIPNSEIINTSYLMKVVNKDKIKKNDISFI